jgi:hypothetical protein
MAHDQEVVGSNLDGCKQFASYYIKEKLKIKVAKWGTPKKYLKKKKKKITITKFLSNWIITKWDFWNVIIFTE